MNMERAFEINTLYLCAPLGFTVTMYKSFPGYSYMDGGILRNSGISRIHRFARDGEVSGTSFCMLLLTQDDNLEKASLFFDYAVKKIARSNKLKSQLPFITLKPFKTEIQYTDEDGKLAAAASKKETS